MECPDWNLHPPRLHSDRPSGALRRLLLSLSRLDLRYLRSHSARTGAVEPRAAALRIPVRHQNSDRLTASRLHPSGFDHERTLDLPAAKRIHAMDGAPAADRRARLFVVHRLPDAAQPELLVDVRWNPDVHARRADYYRGRASDALHAACRPCL